MHRAGGDEQPGPGHPQGKLLPCPLRAIRVLRIRHWLPFLLLLRTVRRVHTPFHGPVASPVQRVAEDASDVRAPPGRSERGRTRVNVSNSA